jgi:hypothetical protein
MLRFLFDASNICLKFIIKLGFEIEKRRKWKKGIQAPLNPLSAQPTSCAARASVQFHGALDGMLACVTVMWG